MNKELDADFKTVAENIGIVCGKERNHDALDALERIRTALIRLSELEGVTTMNRELLETVKLILPHLLKVTSSKAKADYWTAKHVVEKVETLAANRIAKIGGV